MSSKVLREREFKNHVIERLKGLRELSDAGSLFINGNLVDDNVQKFLSLSGRQDWFGSLFLPVIESSALDAERAAPGAGSIYLRLAMGLLSSDLRRDMTFNTVDQNLEDLRDAVCLNTTGICTRSEFYDFMNTTLRSRSREIVERALLLYHLGDQITVKKSYLRDTLVLKTAGYNFDNIAFNRAFLAQGAWSRNNVNVIIVDGIIESVGEIHHLLEKAHESGAPYLIICSGILPEPLDVVIQNVLRRTIDVVVGVINPDEFGIHTMVDLGTVSLTEPISALRGESISQMMTREIKQVDKVEITQASLIIKNDAAKDATNNLLRDVISRSEKDIDIAHLFQKRIKSLSSSRILVSIGRDDVDSQNNVIEETDTFLRSCHMILTRGFIKKEALKEFPKHILDLLFGETDVQPSARIEKALDCYISSRDQINRTGTAIIEERE